MDLRPELGLCTGVGMDHDLYFPVTGISLVAPSWRRVASFA